MRAIVSFTYVAKRDLAEIYVFLEEREGQERADKVVDALEQLVFSLSDHSLRGHVPPELTGLGTKDTYEIHFKPYRIVYTVTDRMILIQIIADGRRDFSALLERRILRGNR